MEVANNMDSIKKLELTNDPLTNIQIMIPLLNDESRKAISYMMYGCFIGEKMARDKEISNKPKELQEV